jgi:hypothetical protein
MPRTCWSRHNHTVKVTSFHHLECVRRYWMALRALDAHERKLASPMSISTVQKRRFCGSTRRAMWPEYRHRQVLQDVERQRFEDEQVTLRFMLGRLMWTSPRISLVSVAYRRGASDCAKSHARETEVGYARPMSNHGQVYTFSLSYSLLHQTSMIHLYV